MKGYQKLNNAIESRAVRAVFSTSSKVNKQTPSAKEVLYPFGGMGYLSWWKV
jgi:hypothetical protein